jgi:hypothetical protein
MNSYHLSLADFYLVPFCVYSFPPSYPFVLSSHVPLSLLPSFLTFPSHLWSYVYIDKRVLNCGRCEKYARVTE